MGNSAPNRITINSLKNMKSTKNILGSVLFATLFVSVSVMPAFAFAQESSGHHTGQVGTHTQTTSTHVTHHKNKHVDTEDRNEHGQEMSGHDDDNGTATSTPPAAPVLSAIAAVRGVSTSTVSWTTNVPATGSVFWSSVTPFVLDASTTQSIATTTLSTSHSFTLSNLVASTTYVFVVQSADAVGTTTSNQFSLTTTPTSTTVTLSAAVVALHNTQNDCWTIINGNVYNITPYIPNHPGGVSTIVSACGVDATSAFTGVGHSSNAVALLANYLLGALGQTITI